MMIWSNEPWRFSRNQRLRHFDPYFAVIDAGRMINSSPPPNTLFKVALIAMFAKHSLDTQ